MSEELKAAQARIACLEGEIAKRDEELAACRVAVENCDLFRARIAELEARIVWLECEAQVNAAPVSEAKAQGVVMPPSPYMPGSQPTDFTDYELGEIHGRIAMWEEVKRLNAAPVQQVSVPVACSCGREYPANSYSAGFISGSGMCEECDAAMPAKDIPQQVSLPLARKALELCDAVENKGDLPLNKWALKTGRLVNEVRDLAEQYTAAPAAPAADAGLVAVEWAKDAEEWGPALNKAGWLFLSELNEDPQKSALIFNNTKGPLRAAIMKYAEIVAAHRAKGVV